MAGTACMHDDDVVVCGLRGSVWLSIIIPLSVGSPSAVHRLGTALDGQTDSVKRTELVCSSLTRPLSTGSEQRSKPRPDGFSQKEQNSSVHRRPVRCPLARNGARSPDGFSQKEQNSSVHRRPVRCPLARNGARSPDGFSQKEQNSSVHRRPVRCPLTRTGT